MTSVPIQQPGNPQGGKGFSSASLYVGDLAPDVTEAVLFDIFNAVGPVASVRVCRDAHTRRSLGYAYVNFHNINDAERALDTMNFTLIRDRPCRVMWSQRDPTLRKSGAGNVFVKNLAPSIDNKSLFDTFSIFGNILSCKVATSPKGVSLGYGFVHYESEEVANTAIASVNGKIIGGQKVYVEKFKPKMERSDTKRFTNVFVKNLPPNATQDQLIEKLSRWGTITSAVVAFDHEKKQSKGFGFANFEKPEQAELAVREGNDVEWDGRKLFVARAQKKEERERELRAQFEEKRLARQRNYAGVNLYIKNLSDKIDKERLMAEFREHGAITSAVVMLDGAKSRGFGFVCFSTPEEATRAVTAMNGKMLDGKPLYVALAQRKEVRRAQLEAQRAQRTRMAMQPMFAQGAPIFFTGPMPGMYPQAAQQMHRRPMPMGAYMTPNMGGMGGPAPGAPLAGGGAGVPGGMHGGQQRGGGGGGARGAGGRQGGGAGGKQYPPRNQQGRVPPPHLAGAHAPGVGVVAGGAGGAGAAGAVGVGAPGTAAAVHVGAGGQVPGAQAGGAAGAGAGPKDAGGAMGIQELAAANEETQKQIIGERLFQLIQPRQPKLAGKITGMLLEMDNGELIHLLESSDALQEKIQEALDVLAQHQTAAHPLESEGAAVPAST